MANNVHASNDSTNHQDQVQPISRQQRDCHCVLFGSLGSQLKKKLGWTRTGDRIQSSDGRPVAWSWVNDIHRFFQSLRLRSPQLPAFSLFQHQFADLGVKTDVLWSIIR
jgi:hypothetical protein